MTTYVVLLRGINVGGKNKVAMAELKKQLENIGCTDVKTYINSGNVIVRSSLTGSQLTTKIETLLPQHFKLDSSIIRVVVLDDAAYKQVIEQAPQEFGQDDERFRYYVLFLIGTTPEQAMQEIKTRPGIDTAWAGDKAVYFRFPSVKSPDATKSYLNKMVGKPIYQQVTMRNWNTTLKIRDIVTTL